MQANWSLVLNVLLLVGVFFTIGRLMKMRRQNLRPVTTHPTVGSVETAHHDDIIAVRKVSRELPEERSEEPIKIRPAISPVRNTSRLGDIPSFGEPWHEEIKEEPTEVADLNEALQDTKTPLDSDKSSFSLMIFLLAKENRQFAGYELLQTVLAAGLRFGEGHLFHRHQYPNGQGPVLCSLAAATASGTFDLQNIGAFSVRGLCLFMQASGNSTIDAERLSILLDTAKQLSEGLDAKLLNDQQRPLTDAEIERYYRLINVETDESPFKNRQNHDA